MCCNRASEAGAGSRWRKVLRDIRSVLLEHELSEVQVCLRLEVTAVADAASAFVPVSDSPQCGQEAVYCGITDWSEEPREIIPY